MRHHRTLFGGALMTFMAVASLAAAQAPRSPGDVVPLFEERKGPPRSDAYRVVGKVLAVDKTKGTLDLETDEGRMTVKASAPLVAAARVGDIVSVDRSDEGVYASPRGEQTKDPRRKP